MIDGIEGVVCLEWVLEYGLDFAPEVKPFA